MKPEQYKKFLEDLKKDEATQYDEAGKNFSLDDWDLVHTLMDEKFWSEDPEPETSEGEIDAAREKLLALASDLGNEEDDNA